MKETGMNKRVNLYIVAAAVVIIAGIAVILALALGRKEETYRSIKIIELEGGVTIDREGVGILEAANNMNLISGDSLQTAQGAYAVLQLDSDKYVMLAESGRMSVIAEGDEVNSRTSIQLETGSVLSEIQNPLSSGSSYDIVTPNATMSVRGTVFEVRRNSDNIEVLVYDGKVAVGLEGKEPILYEAGEYTQFTDEETPRFLIERTEITEEVLNDQVLDRLEQIDSQSRELNLGAVQLASAQTQDGSLQTTPVPEATTKPVPTVQPTPSVAPSHSAAPTATPTPAKTPQPQVSNIGTVQATPEAVSPEPEEKESDDDDWDWDDRWNNDWNSGNSNDWNSGNNHDWNGGNNHDWNSGNSNDWNGGNNHDWNNGNNHNSGNKPQESVDYTNFWQTYTMAEYEKAVEKSVNGTECIVIYYLPYIVEAEASGDSDDYVSKLVNTPSQDYAPQVYDTKETKVGTTLTAPQEPEGCIGDNGDSLEFVGWCLEDGTMWKFDEGLEKGDTVKADICLYPVWKEKNEEGEAGEEDEVGEEGEAGGASEESTYYYPVFARSNLEEARGYYCNNVKEGSRLAEISLSGNAGSVIWKNVNSSTDDNIVEWKFESDTVEFDTDKKALSLEAVRSSTSE